MSKAAPPFPPSVGWMLRKTYLSGVGVVSSLPAAGSIAFFIVKEPAWGASALLLGVSILAVSTMRRYQRAFDSLPRPRLAWSDALYRSEGYLTSEQMEVELPSGKQRPTTQHSHLDRLIQTMSIQVTNAPPGRRPEAAVTDAVADVEFYREGEYDKPVYSNQALWAHEDTGLKPGTAPPRRRTLPPNGEEIALNILVLREGHWFFPAQLFWPVSGFPPEHPLIAQYELPDPPYVVKVSVLGTNLEDSFVGWFRLERRVLQGGKKGVRLKWLEGDPTEGTQ